MASTFHDSALGTRDATGGALATTDALTVTAGDLVWGIAKWEANDGASMTMDTGAATPQFNTANDKQIGSGTGFASQTFWWIATSTGTINPRMVPSSNVDFSQIRAMSFTPSAFKSLTKGAVNTNTGSSTTPTSGSASIIAGGVVVGGMGLFGSNTLTPGTGWTEPAEFNVSTTAHAEYRLPTSAGSFNADGTLSGSIQWTDQIAVFDEIGLTITLVSPWLMYDTQTGVLVQGILFGASQGTGSVTISPSDNVADAGAVTQTVTAWADTSISFTAVRGSLGTGTLYLFATDGSGNSNASGYPVQFVGSARLAWTKA